MKTLYSYFEELATPMNTMGIGNPMVPTDTTPGTEPICAKCKREKRKKKNIKESLLTDDKQIIFTVIKPGFLNISKQIIDVFEKNGFIVYKIKTKQLVLKEAHKLYDVHKKEDFYEDLCKYMSSEPTTAIIYKANKSIKNIFKTVEKIKEEIREKYGESDMRNVLHSSDSYEHMMEEIGVYF